LHGPHGKYSLCCWNVFIKPLHSNGRRSAGPIENSLSIVEVCLPSPCLAMLWPSTLQYVVQLMSSSVFGHWDSVKAILHYLFLLKECTVSCSRPWHLSPITI
jgi:hypothetical protein